MKVFETLGGIYTELRRLNSNLEAQLEYTRKIEARANPPLSSKEDFEATVRKCMKRGSELLERWDAAYVRKMESNKGGVA